MVLWQSELRVSWRAQWLSLLLHGLVAALVLLMPWPLSYTPLWLLLLSLVVFDCVRSQRRINACHGEIKLLMDSRLRWQGVEWDIVGTPWMVRSGMMLRLRREEDGRRQHLWLAADSMDAQEWRDLRRMILQKPAQGLR
ncbi:protein YgfX [Kosakonia sp. BYX6]|uniref:Protein YgfX n=1 Tax=Kosakonia calanthes TaxID=3139408 RepID=A0ABZ3B726_9ENTR